MKDTYEEPEVFWCPMCGVDTFPVAPKTGEDCYCEICKKTLDEYQPGGMNEYKENICYKLRSCVAEYGQEAVTDAIIIGPENYEVIGGHKYIQAPTLGSAVLANVDWQVARFFEDTEELK